jgi:hypothetical protein
MLNRTEPNKKNIEVQKSNGNERTDSLDFLLEKDKLEIKKKED